MSSNNNEKRVGDDLFLRKMRETGSGDTALVVIEEM